MLTENFLAATFAAPTNSNIPSTLKDIGIVLHELQPHSTIRHGFKKSSAKSNCVAVSDTHIFAAQADKAVVHVYSRSKGIQEATVAFPERIHSLTFAGESSGFLALGTEGGKLIVWDIASGRQTISTSSHLQSVSHLSFLPNNNWILSGSTDSNIQIWSLSNLVSFAQSQSLSSSDPAPNAPLRTFSNHRSGISALSCGQSRLLANFAVSASSDSTCYIWNVGDCQILRTILFPSPPECFVLDPADRAIYSGHTDGGIQCFDFLQDSLDRGTSLSAALYPRELQAEKRWSPASADIGSAQCLTLSYDGSILLSGHSSGKVLSWDVAKYRVLKMVADLVHPVTNIIMQRPEGLPHKSPPIEVATIVKPKIEGTSSSHHASISGIPTNYFLRVQIMPQPASPPRPHNASLSAASEEIDFSKLLAHPIFPKHLIDEAVLDLTSPITQNSDPNASSYDIPFPHPPSTTDSALVEKLQTRILNLEETLSAYATATERSRARRLARMERREEFGRKKREAYFEAVRGSAHSRDAGMDAEGNAGMRLWAQREEEVDRESDEVECAEEVYGDV